jgi:hypothetical protein
MSTPSSKRCPSCCKRKKADEFGINDSQADGLQVYCRPCQAAAGRASYQRHIETRRKANRERMRLKRIKLRTDRRAARVAQ